MNEVICLDPAYSTTRCLSRHAAHTQKSAVAKFEPLLCLPSNSFRKAEGGLRKQGYFKLAASDQGQTPGGSAVPLITVITAVFNAEKTLEDTILSVISQSYGNIEYIIIDGGSTDSSVEIVRKYEHLIDYWVAEPDDGIYDAWNKGVSLARGDWIAFLGADDVYRDGAIESYMHLAGQSNDQRPEYISSRVNLAKGETILAVVGAPWQWRKFRKYNLIAHVGSFHHRSLFEAHGLFDASYKISGDYEFLLRSGKDLRAKFLDLITVNMQVGGVSDANFRVFSETTRAKILTGKRNALLSHGEKYWAIFKWKLRNLLRS